MTWLDRLAIAMLNQGRCPDCTEKGFRLGPRGGAAQNIECANPKCRARFNVSRFSAMDHVVIAERIPKESEGGAAW